MKALYFEERKAREEYIINRLDNVNIKPVGIPLNTDFFNMLSSILCNTVDKIELARELCEPDNHDPMDERTIQDTSDAFRDMLYTRFYEEWEY